MLRGEARLARWRCCMSRVSRTRLGSSGTWCTPRAPRPSQHAARVSMRLRTAAWVSFKRAASHRPRRAEKQARPRRRRRRVQKAATRGAPVNGMFWSASTVALATLSAPPRTARPRLRRRAGAASATVVGLRNPPARHGTCGAHCDARAKVPLAAELARPAAATGVHSPGADLTRHVAISARWCRATGTRAVSMPAAAPRAAAPHVPGRSGSAVGYSSGRARPKIERAHGGTGGVPAANFAARSGAAVAAAASWQSIEHLSSSLLTRSSVSFAAALRRDARTFCVGCAAVAPPPCVWPCSSP